MRVQASISSAARSHPAIPVLPCRKVSRKPFIRADLSRLGLLRSGYMGMPVVRGGFPMTRKRALVSRGEGSAAVAEPRRGATKGNYRLAPNAPGTGGTAQSHGWGVKSARTGASGYKVAG